MAENELWTCSCGEQRWTRESPGEAAQHDRRYHSYCKHCGVDRDQARKGKEYHHTNCPNKVENGAAAR